MNILLAITGSLFIEIIIDATVLYCSIAVFLVSGPAINFIHSFIHFGRLHLKTLASEAFDYTSETVDDLESHFQVGQKNKLLL